MMNINISTNSLNATTLGGTFVNESLERNESFLEDISEQQYQQQFIDYNILLLDEPKRYVLEVSLFISSICLVASFLVYSSVPELRTVPGKCLMGLIVSELSTNLFVIVAIHNSPKPHSLTCFIIGISIHYFFLTLVCWTSVIGECVCVCVCVYVCG